MHHAVHNVGIADKVRHKGIFRLIVDILGGTDLLHLAAVHYNNGIRHGQGLFLIVGNINKGDVHLTLQTLKLQLHLLAELKVQCTQRLVQQQDLRLIDQTAGNGNTLLLAAGHLADAAALKALQADHLQHIAHLAADGLFVHLLQAQAKGGHTGNILALQQHLTRVGFQEACDQAQGGGLAAAGRTQQRYELFVMDVQVQPIQNALTVKFHHDIAQ